MASLLGTLGSMGMSVLGDLFSKGVKSVGDVASNKLDNWKKENTQSNSVSNKKVKKIEADISNLKDRMKRIENKSKT